MDYDDALNIVEKFNVESGLRDFCTNKCKGACCWKCTDHCFKYNERRILCSVFFCAPMRKILFTDRDKRAEYKRIQNSIKKHIEDHIDARNAFYHHPTDKEMSNIQKSEFPESIRDLESLDVDKIRKIIKNITDDQLYYLQNHEKINERKCNERRRKGRK